MRNLPLAVAVVLFSTSTAFLVAKDSREYKGKDGTRVVILPIRKWTRDAAYKSYESRVEFYSPQHEMLCALDYSSEDCEHGFCIVKAAWTPDNNYFVFSLTSSGGHQSWHFPTHFYSTQDSKIYTLDDYIEGSGISKGDFTLKAPNEVLTSVQREEEVPVRFHLDKLVAKSHSMTRAMICADANVIKPQN
jgi:hypothetical protein